MKHRLSFRGWRQLLNYKTLKEGTAAMSPDFYLVIDLNKINVSL